MSGSSFHDTSLFTPAEHAELERIAQVEARRERLRRAGEKLARESRARQGLNEMVEVPLWTD